MHPTARSPTMLWTSGGFTLRIRGDGARRDAIVSAAEPYAVIGRAPGAAVVLDDPAVSARHAYLHLDRRGLFAVDLATRTGTRIGPHGGLSGWLRPGDRVEVAGREIEVLALRRAADPEADSDEGGPGVAGATIDQGDPPSPLDDTGADELARLTLFPESGPRDPLSLNSRLVFVGRSPACAVPVDSPSALRVQCVLVRDEAGVFVVDLVGRGTWVNGRPLRGADALADGDSLMVGSARFQCRVEAPAPPRPGLPMLNLGSRPPALHLHDARDDAPAVSHAPPMHLIPPESQAAVLGWLMGQIQARQDEAGRRQADFQVELVRLVAEIHRDNHAVLNRHMERADTIQKELTSLREEMSRRFGHALPPGAQPGPAALSAPRLPPLKIAPAAPPEDAAAAANWLLSRVNQLDQENRRGWKDLLGRLVGSGDADDPGGRAG